MSQKAVLVIVVIAVIVLGGGAFLLVKDSTKNQPTTETDMSNMQQSTSNTKSPTPTATDVVTIENFAFSPANITVKKGTTVTWTNKDSAAHTVTQDSNTPGGPGMDSKGLSQGESYTATFTTAGTFKYHCAFHSSMSGTVTVTE